MRLARPKKPYKINVVGYNFFKKYENITNFQSIRPRKRTRDPVVVNIRQLKYSTEGFVCLVLIYLYSRLYRQLATITT